MSAHIAPGLKSTTHTVGTREVVDVAIVDGSGNQITAFGGSGGTSHSDDAAFTIGGASSVTPAAFLADETTPDSVDEGDVGVPRMTLTRKAYAVLSDKTAENAAGVDASGHLQVDIAADSVGIGGGTQYTEDAAAAANPVGNAMIVVRDDARGGSLTTTDGDNVALRGTNAGELYVKHVDEVSVKTENQLDFDTGAGTDTQSLMGIALPASGGAVAGGTGTNPLRVDPTGTTTQPVSLASVPSHAVTNAGTFVVQVDGTALTRLTDIETNTDAGAVVGNGLAATAQRVTLANDSTGIVALTTSTASIGKLASNTGVDIGDVDVTSVVPGTGATNLGKAEDAAHTTGDVGVMGLTVRQDTAAALAGTDADYQPLITDASGRLHVLDANSAAIKTAVELIDNAIAGTEMQVDVVAALPAGTNNIGDVDVLTIAAGDNNIGNVDIVTMPGVVGTVADDGTTPGAPVMVGGSMKNFDGTTPGEVSAEDDVVRAIFDPNRRQYVNQVHPQFWSYHENSSSALTDAAVQAAPGVGKSIFVTDVVVSTGAATAMNVFFEEATTTVLGPYYLEAVAGRGLVIRFATPKQITANTALTITTSAAIAHGIDVTGFIADVT